MATRSLTRRDFLVRSGVLGAVVALYPAVAARRLRAAAQPIDGLAPVLAQLRTVLQALARDTFDGLSSFIIPGPDPYSVAQGVTSPRPGAIAAKATDFVMASADFFVPFPDRLLAEAAVALSEGLRSSPVSLPPELAGVPLSVTDQLDDAVRAYIENDQTIPAAVIVALLLNQLAVMTNPAAVSGQFLSPFARLTFAEKLAAWESLEGAEPDLVATIDANLPSPETESVSGVMRFLGSALPAFVGFFTYNEAAAFDATTRTLTGRPLGWTLTGYQPDGPVDGWDEFKGYFQGRRRATS
jgi:hypothetical protein